jgi:hypothetical protein
MPVRSGRTGKSVGECQWPVIALSLEVARALAMNFWGDEFGRDRESDLKYDQSTRKKSTRTKSTT